MRFLYFFIILLRIIFGPLILVFPLPSIILSIFLDAIDAEFAHYVVSKKQYQLIDKLLDLWGYVFELIFALIYLNYKIFLLFLFLWRMIGTVIFYLIKNRKIFFIFANYFENFFLVIFISKYFDVKTNINLLFFIAFLTKLFQEWFLHISQKSFREDILKIKRFWKN